MSESIERELGAISAHLKNINNKLDHHGAKIDGMDERLRSVEAKSAINGAISGGIVAVAIGLIKNTLSNGS